MENRKEQRDEDESSSSSWSPMLFHQTVCQGLTLDSSSVGRSCAKQPSLAQPFIGLVANVSSMSTVSCGDTLQFVTSLQFKTVYTQFYFWLFPKTFKRFSVSDIAWLTIHILLRFFINSSSFCMWLLNNFS